MKKTAIALTLLLMLSLCSCAAVEETGGVAATTLPVYQFTAFLCQGTQIPVTRLVTEGVSCLHDYTLKVSQVKAAERASHIVISGGGLEGFMADLLEGKSVIDASEGIPLLEGCHEEGHEGHHHEADPHLWLSPVHALQMAENIHSGLRKAYPAQAEIFDKNMDTLTDRLTQLQAYGTQQLKGLSCNELITFHDGFSYFAEAFGLHILAAVEEESGSESSARDLIELIGLVRAHSLPAVFVEENGSDAAADVICAETGVRKFTLSMAMSGEDYFQAMYHNIDVLKEALG